MSKPLNDYKPLHELLTIRLSKIGKGLTIEKFERLAVENGVFETSIRSAGKYAFSVDSLPPIIEAKNFTRGQNLKNFRYLTVNLKDNETSIKRYNGYIDDQWVLFEYEPKDNTLKCDLNDSVLLEGRHTILIEAEDAVNNRSSYKAQFEIK